MGLKDFIWIYNSIIYSLLYYFIPFGYNAVYLSNINMNHFICRLCGFRVFLYGDEFNPNESSTILCNHKAMYDILATFYISGYFNQVVGFCLKKQVAYIPGVGWWCKRMKFPVLNRNKDDLKTLETSNMRFPVVIYPEGTRYSDKKYKESYQFAKQNDYPISKYAQLPKSKGSFILSKDIVYHMTLVYLDKENRIITGEIKEFPHCVYIHIKKHTSVPRDENDYKKWIQEQFASIDDIYDNFNPFNAIEMKPTFQTVDWFLYAGYISLHIAFGYWLFAF